MSNIISVFNDETLHDPKNYQVLRLLYQTHLSLGRRVPKYAFMPRSMAHILRQTCKVYGGIFELIEKVTQGQDVKESHGKYTGAIKPLEDILLSLRASISHAPKQRMNELVLEQCELAGSIPATIRKILAQLEGVKSSMVNTLQDISRVETFKGVTTPIDTSLSGFDEEFISYIIDLGEIDFNDIGLDEEGITELRTVLNDIRDRYSAAMKATKNLNFDLIINVIVINVTVVTNLKTPGGKEKLKDSTFWSRIKTYLKKVKDVLNAPITPKSNDELNIAFVPLADIITRKKPTLDLKLFDNLAAMLPTVQRSFYLQSLFFVDIFGKHFEDWKNRNTSEKSYDSMIRRLTSTARATEAALQNAKDAQHEDPDNVASHQRLSESTFKMARDCLKELLQEAGDNIEQHEISFSNARKNDWKSVEDLKIVLKDDW